MSGYDKTLNPDLKELLALFSDRMIYDSLNSKLVIVKLMIFNL